MPVSSANSNLTMESAANLIHKRRSSTNKACLRCHRRKQRCFGYPTCSNCEAAGLSCSRDSTPTMRRLAGLSKEELMKKIEELEDQGAAGNERSGENSRTPVSIRRASITSTLSESSTRRTAETGIDNEPEDAQMNDLQHTSPLQYPPSSLRSVSSMADTDQATPILIDAEFSKAESYNSRLGFSKELEEPLLTTYLESMHRRIPFCDYHELLTTLNTSVGGTTETSPSNMQLFRLHMACAIGACVRQLNGRLFGRPPESYQREAVRIQGSLDPALLIEQVEVLLWTVLYKLRSSFSSDIWYLIGSAIRKAVDADMHREYTYEDLDPTEANLRRCLFWAVYVTERNISWSLKRPFSLCDSFINTKLPEPIVLQTSLGEDETTSRARNEPCRPLDLSIYITLIKLARIKAATFKQLYPFSEHSSITEEVPSILHEIRELEASLPQCGAPDREVLLLHTKNAIRILIEPYLQSLSTSDVLAHSCLEASGSVCQLFKRLRFDRNLGFSFTMVNSVFTAGVTICYLLFRDPKLWTPTTANDLRACSSTLFAAAERNGMVRKYCDTLETIIERAMHHVEQASNIPSSVGNDLARSPPSPLDPHTPPGSFETLKEKLKAAKLDFPAGSYPSYCTEPEVWRKGSTGDWASQAKEIGFGSDQDLQESEWFVSCLDDTMGMSSIEHLLGGQSGW